MKFFKAIHNTSSGIKKDCFFCPEYGIVSYENRSVVTLDNILSKGDSLQILDLPGVEGVLFGDRKPVETIQGRNTSGNKGRFQKSGKKAR